MNGRTVDDTIVNPPWGSWGRSITLGIVSGWSKMLLHVLNTTTTNNLDVLLHYVNNRHEGQGLITVCNHTSTLDDPAVISAMIPWQYFWTDPSHNKIRWSLCAEEICFQNELLRMFFLNGKTLPIQRGKGVDQPIMDVAAKRLGTGDWLHVFPEGRIHFNGKLGPFRWGLGKLICDARRNNDGRDPIILPFYHSGMGDVMPMHSVIPRVGAKVSVTIGHPIEVSDITCRCNQPGQDQQQVWKELTERLYTALKKLESESPSNTDQVKQKVEQAENKVAPS